jgi:hypothetical protein
LRIVLVFIKQRLASYSHCIHASLLFPGKLHSPLCPSGFFLPEQALDSRPGWQSLEEKWVRGEWVSIGAAAFSFNLVMMPEHNKRR